LKAELQCVKEDLEMVCVERDELVSEKDEYKGLEEQLANTKEMHRNREKECLVQTKESEQQWREKMEDQEDDYCRVRKDLEEELNEVRARCCKLEQENGEYAGELTVLRDNGTNLASELETSKKAVQSLQSELDKTINTADTYQQLQQERDDLSKAFKALELCIADLNEHNVTLQDDYSRLRNVNAMMKTKMVADASESSTVMGQKDGYLKQIASLTEQTQSLQVENIALSDHKTDMQLEMNKMERECKDLTASLSRLQEKWEGKISEFQMLEKKIGELQQEHQDMIKMMEAKGKADTQKHIDLKVDRQKIQDDHSSERRETDAQIAKLQMHTEKLDEEREESIQKAASMEMEMTQLQEAIGKLQDERIDMKQQREEKMTKLQENMDTLREVRDAMESKPNDLIVPTNNDNVQQEHIDNFDSNRLDTIVVRRTSLDTEESSKAPIMAIKAPIVLASVPVGVQTPATAADITIRVDSAKATRTAATTTDARTSCNRHRLNDSTSPLPTPFHLQSNLSGVRSSLFSPQQEGQPIPQHHQQMHQHQQLHDQQLHTR